MSFAVIFEFNLVFLFCFHRIIHGDHITDVEDCFCLYLFVIITLKLFSAAATALHGCEMNTVAQ